MCLGSNSCALSAEILDLEMVYNDGGEKGQDTAIGNILETPWSSKGNLHARILHLISNPCFLAYSLSLSRRKGSSDHRFSVRRFASH